MGDRPDRPEAQVYVADYSEYRPGQRQEHQHERVRSNCHEAVAIVRVYDYS